jgi:hypothetical protein
MTDLIRSQYAAQRHKEGIKDSFMQGSRQLSNAVIVQRDGQSVVFSDKYQRILEIVSQSGNQLHMVYSNFIQHGCTLFRNYCMQTGNWEEVVVDSKGSPSILDQGGNKHPYKPAIDNRQRLAMVHGDMDVDSRNKLIQLFNSPDNADGKYIRVIVLSPASMEGLNLKCVRHVHILEPQWSWA